MQKPIADMGRYIKSIIPLNIPETYPIKPIFNLIGDDETIRNGVVLFRDFLFQLCDCLISDGYLYDKPPKDENNIKHGVSLAVCYPFINELKNVLFNIGFHGRFIENNTIIIIDDWQQLTFTMGMYGEQQKTRITTPKVIKALRFLTYCGFHLEDINLDETKMDFPKNTQFAFTFPDNPDMLIGMKTMATAQRTFAVKGNNDAFLRCDYRILTEDNDDVIAPLKEYIRILPDKEQDFILELHNDAIEWGMTCKIDVFFLIIRFVYYYKNKEIWSFSMSVDSGFRILIKAKNTHLYADIIEKFPLPLQEKIARGYGCNKKLYGEPCQKGCHGFNFPVNNSIFDIAKELKIWINKELSLLQR